jgi:uncharacterized protein (DUF1684 family)
MLDLLDYRRRVFELYRAVREGGAGAETCARFRQGRDDLFAHHLQSALDAVQKAAFTGLRYYDYEPSYRVTAQIDWEVSPDVLEVELGDDGHFAYRRIGRVTFDLPTGRGALSLFWITGYGGGLFLPFRDGTNSQTTYGGGRYLYDTIKGADLGAGGDSLVLDFNYAYNPSCAYHARWVCPLAPPENRLSISIPAGELAFERVY